MDKTSIIATLLVILIVLLALTLVVALIVLFGHRRRARAQAALVHHPAPPVQPESGRHQPMPPTQPEPPAPPAAPAPVARLPYARTTTPPAQPEPPAPSISAPVARLPYARIPTLLTAAEREFFAALQTAAPAGLLIVPQVRLANLVEVERWARKNNTHWYRIQAKSVDFVLCDATTTAPRLVVELDDASHDRPDRRDRDAFVDAVLSAVGLPILHIRWQRRYDPRELATHIAAAFSTPAPQPPGATGSAPKPVAAIAPPAYAPRPTPRAIPNPPAKHLEAMPSFTTRYACGQCQADIRSDARFCPTCGAVLAA